MHSLSRLFRRTVPRYASVRASQPESPAGHRTRRSAWTARLAGFSGLLALLVGSALPAFAATGTLYATGINTGAGTVKMGSHMWVSDHFQGFCRLDPTAGGTSAINTATCNTDALAPGQSAYDPATHFVYVPDQSTKSLGVYRLTFDPATETVGNAVLLAPGKGLGGNRANAAALGPDGMLYVGFIKSGNIARVSSPAGNPALQQVQVIGGTSDGRGVAGMAFIGRDLYLAEGGDVSRIANATGCASGCKAASVGIQGTDPVAGLTPTAIGSDGASVLYVADTPFSASTVLRVTVSTGVQDVYARAGTLPGGGTAGFQEVGSLSVDAGGNLTITDGPADSPSGHVWTIAAGSAPISTIGGGAGTTPPLTTSSLYAAGVTLPAGQVWMGSHLWVADTDRGFCRLDAQADGTYGIDGATCNTSAVVPGQPAYDPATNFVFLPDGDLLSQGIWRLSFNPTTETVGTPTLLAPGKGLGGNAPSAVALGPDGHLYAGSVKNPSVVRVTNPAGATASQVVQVIGGSNFGDSIESLAFVGRDLYISQELGLARMANATACLSGCKGTLMSIAATPSAVASGGNVLYVANGGSVLRYTPSTNAVAMYTNEATLADGSTTPFAAITALAVDATGNVSVGDDPDRGRQTALGHVWQAPFVP